MATAKTADNSSQPGNMPDWIIGRPVPKYALKTPEGRVAMVADFGNDLDKTKSEMIVFTAECEEFNHPYISLKISEAHKRGVKIKVSAGPVLVTANYTAEQSEAYVAYYSHPAKIKASKWEKLGSSFMITQDWLAARLCYDKLLEKKPDDMRLLLLASTASCYGGDLERAVNDSFFAVMVDSKSYDARNNLGYAYLQQGNTKEALVSLNKAYNLAATVNEETGSVDRQSVENILNNLGDAHRMNGNYNRAMQYYSRVLNLNPHHPGTFENFGACRTAVRQ
ncbi:MAG: tetratricopeptide repeat protein [Nanoarchaeota archaeon]|nr:tetratricopeptide repeat protein [Nanoarchaeota archaeon]